jgi:hypothetical protein
MAVGISFGRKDEEGIETDIVVGASIYCTARKDVRARDDIVDGCTKADRVDLPPSL